MSLSLDSGMVVDLIQGRKTEVCARFDAARSSGESLAVSSLVYHELAFAALHSRRPEQNLRLLDTVLRSIELEAWSGQDALAAACVRNELAAAGTPIGFIDTMIAGHARSRGHALVTGNVRHFALVAELTLIDWSMSSQPIDPRTDPTSLRRAREKD